MITNATLTSIAAPTGNAAGKVLFSDPTTLDARCALTMVEQRHRVQLGAVIASATAVLYVLKSFVADEPTPGEKLIANVDGSAAKSYRVVHVRNWEKSGGLSHWELFLQELLA